MNKLKNDFGVRGLFGVLLIAGFIATTFYAIKTRPDTLAELKNIYSPIVMLVIGFYFGAGGKGNNGTGNRNKGVQITRE